MKIKTFEEKREGTQQVDQNTRIFFIIQFYKLIEEIHRHVFQQHGHI